MTEHFLSPTQESGSALLQRNIAGPVFMLNLLRFRKIADYSAHPQLAPAAPVSGEAAYRLYMERSLPYLRKSGGEIVFMGKGGPFLIGPPAEHWDMALLIRQHSVASFMAFASDDAYLEGIGHRLAAIEDSRLLPLTADMFAAGPA